jgi:hypothetical protein
MIRPPSWLSITWSTPAAMRALRATLVVPGLFALTFKGIDDLQMATFAAFGGFATLVMAAFGGSRRDKALAHLGLAVAGSVLLVIGTAVHATTWLVVVVTIPVVFAVLFAGVIGPNVAAGGTAALLAYVLPAASPGTIDMVPNRLAGWWMASVIGTAAVLLLSPRPPGDALRGAAARSTRALADHLDAALRGDDLDRYRKASIEAKHALRAQFTAAPYRPTNLTTADQALAALVGVLEWATALLCDSLAEYGDLRKIPEVERELFTVTSAVLWDTAGVLDGAEAVPDVDRLDRALEASVAALRRMSIDGEYAEAVDLSFHARTFGYAARASAVDALAAPTRPRSWNGSGVSTAFRRRFRGRSGGSACWPARAVSPCGTPACARSGSSTACAEPWRWPPRSGSRTSAESSTASGWCWERCRCCAPTPRRPGRPRCAPCWARPWGS